MAKIGLVMATWNGRRFLGEMLDSLVRQTRRIDAMVAVDDGSSDGTPEILESYAGKLPMRVVVLPENGGHLKAFETGLSLLREELGPGDLVALADQDDVWNDDHVELLERSLGGADMVFGDAEAIDAAGDLLAPSWRAYAGIPAELPVRARVAGTNNATGCLSLFRASLLDAALPFPEGVALHDWWLALCAAARAGAKAVPDAVARYRLHGNNAVGAGRNYPFRETIHRQRRWCRAVAEEGERIGLGAEDVAFARELLDYWTERGTRPLLWNRAPWLWRNRAFLFPRRERRAAKLLFSTLGAPAVRLLFGEGK
ncbi:MAG: glycosyltransferase [Fibrobacterales bacterium]|nr:glycosyltransferase [Fibrobacterales bacterium]MBP5188850.1 glycosyltransferase [Fibrobacterales bacterium]MBP5351134.1 glycosyltransferase [Fibrobacterales bacterium]